MSGLIKDIFPSILGSGIPGGQPKGGLIGHMEGGGDRGMFRLIMRNSFGRVGINNTRRPTDSSVYTRSRQVNILTKTYNNSKF